MRNIFRKAKNICGAAAVATLGVGSVNQVKATPIDYDSTCVGALACTQVAAGGESAVISVDGSVAVVTAYGEGFKVQMTLPDSVVSGASSVGELEFATQYSVTIVNNAFGSDTLVLGEDEFASTFVRQGVYASGFIGADGVTFNQASSSGGTNPVPEPSSLAILAAGLAIAGVGYRVARPRFADAKLGSAKLER